MQKMIGKSIDKIENKGRPGLRLLVEILVAVLVALFIELGFNFHGLTEGYGPKEILDYYTTDGGRLVYELKMEQPEYIGKLFLKGTVHKDLKYTVKLVTVNDFGGLEEESFQDYLYTELNCGISNINARIQELSISITKPDRVEISEVSYSNEFAFDWYRFCFFFLVGFLALLIILERRLLLEKIWVIYLIGALGFGGLLVEATGPFTVTWDEEAHYSTVHRLNPSGTVKSDDSTMLNFQRQGWKLNTKEEYSLIREYMDTHADGTEVMEGYRGFKKEYISYFPMVVAYQMGRWLDLSYSTAYLLGKLGNLLFCSILCALAIFLADRKKILIAALGLMPTVLFQSSTYTYDGVIFSLLLLGTVLGCKELEKENDSVSMGNILLAGLLILSGCVSKPVYLPLLLLLVPSLYKRWKKVLNSKKGKKLIIGTSAILLVVVLVVFAMKLWPLVSSMLSGDASYGGDPRGGGTGMAGQLLSVVRHPVSFVKMFLREAFSFDHFRNYQDNGENTVLIFSQMFLNLYVLGTLKNVWTLVLFPLLLLLYLVEPEGEKPFPKNKKQISWLGFGACILCVMLIWLAMYLAFTPIGQGSIEGVQARYYLPLCLPAAYVLWNHRIQVRISRRLYYQIGMGATLFLTGQCIYQLVIQNLVS